MQILVLVRRRTEAFTEAQFAELLEPEAEVLRTLYAEGIVRSAWSRADVLGACLMLERASLDDAQAAFGASSARGRGDARSAVCSVARLSRLRPARLIVALGGLLAAQIELSPVSFPTKASDGVTLTGTLYEPPEYPTARVPACRDLAYVCRARSQ